jgi:poly(3-hydroxybutyrate) depolymerase
MTDTFNDLYCIDNSRIYAAGKSNGGGFVGGVLACDTKLSTKIAAFAPVAGAFYIPNFIEKGCNPGRPDIPILEFHGGNDGVIPYSGGPRR